MTLKARAALLIQANEDLPDNTEELISPEDVRTLFKNVIDSFVSKYGDTGILGVLQYSNTHDISDEKDLVYAAWVDDEIAELSLLIDGSNTMAASIDMNHFTLDNLDNLIVGNANTDINSIPLVIDADSLHNTYLMALGKDGNSAYFRVDKDGNISDIGGGTARISTADGLPFFPDGFQTSSIKATGLSMFFLDNSGAPFFFDNSDNTTDDAIGMLVTRTSATSPGNIASWTDQGLVELAFVDKDGNIGLGDSEATDGAWRQRIDVYDLVFEKRESNVWNEKFRISA